MAGLSDLAMRILIGAEDRTGPAFKTVRQGTQSISDSLARVETLAKRVFDIRLFAGWAQDGIALSDTYKGLTGRIRQTVDETGNLADKQGQLFTLAQRTFTPLEQTVKLYARGSEALEKYSNGQALAAKLTETVNYSFKAQASSAAEVSSTITQLTQAIASDAVQWEDFGQLADTNLMLVNVAAKNLGYDGIGALKQAMSEGRVGNVELVNAIVAGFDEIKAAADKMPVTVEEAWTNVQTSLLKYVGESEAANGATHALAEGLQLLAGNIEPLADAGMLLAEIYGARVAAGLLKSAQTYIQATQAAREKAQADQMEIAAAHQNIRISAQVAAARVKSTLGMVEEARLYAALVAGTEKETAAKRTLTAAINELHIAQSKASAANAVLASASGAGAAQVGKLEKAFALANNALNSFIAFDLGQTVGEWLRQFDAVRVAGSYLSETLVMIGTGVAGMFDGISLAERWEQIKRIHAEFDQIRANDTVKAEQETAATVAAEQQKTQAIEAATQKQQAAFKVVEDATKQLTAGIDAEAKRQTAAIQQSLADRLAAIDAMNLSEAEKDNLRVQAKLESYNLELQLQTQATNAKLGLIDQEYQAELAQAASNAERLAEVETQKRQAKLSVYSGLAEYYQGEVARLGQVYAAEFQAAQTAKQQLANLNRSHEQNLFDISLMGLSEREKLSAREYKFNQTMRDLRAELAKGDQGDQAKINGLLAAAQKLHGEITSTAGKGSSAIVDAKKRENEIFKAQTEVLERNAGDHEKNADRAKAAQDDVANKLAETRTAIADITTKLNQDYALKIGVDQASLTAIQSTIADLTKPETKVITIQTVQSGAPAQATGGPAGQPAGLPWRFNAGGYTPRSGKLPGYGGGDKIRALLEAGEFIIRKEAVQKLGVPFMYAVNAGQVPARDVIKRAFGGTVGYDMDDELKKLKDKRAEDIIKHMIANARVLGLNSSGTGYSAMRAKRNIGLTLEKMGRSDLGSAVSDIIDNSIVNASAIGANTKAAAARNQEKFDRARILTEHLFDSDQTAKLPEIKTPKLSIPTPSIPTVPKTAATAPVDAGPGRTERIQFIAPNGQSLTGEFKPGGTEQMLRILKDAGAVTI